jgi:hypothetical protein
MACGDEAHGMWMRTRDDILLCPVTRRYAAGRKQFVREHGRRGWKELRGNIEAWIGGECSMEALLRSAPDGSPRAEVRQPNARP